jgi:hypothetical protein
MLLRRVLWTAGLFVASLLIARSAQPTNLLPVVAGVAIGFGLVLVRLWWLAEHDAHRYTQAQLRDMRVNQWRSREVRNGALIGVVIATVISSAGSLLGVRPVELVSLLLAFVSGGMLAVLTRSDRDREIRV